MCCGTRIRVVYFIGRGASLSLGRIGSAKANSFFFKSLRHLGSDRIRSQLIILNFYSGVGWAHLSMCCGIRVRVMYFIGRGASLSLGRIGEAYTQRFLFWGLRHLGSDRNHSI